MTYATVTFDKENASPALVNALSELARLAIEHTSKPVLPTAGEPQQEPKCAEQDSPNNGTNND